MKTLSLTLLAALAFFPAAKPMFGEVIVSDTAGGTSGSNSAFLAVSWTQTGTFDDVKIQAPLESDTPNFATGTAYLSNKLGSGAGNGNVLDTFSISTNNNDPSTLITLFTGLTLGPGTYFLSIQESGSLFWIDAGSAVKTLASGVTQGSDFNSSGTIGAPPISTSFVDVTTFQPLFEVSGVPVTSTATPEPSTIVFLVGGLGSIVFGRRFRKGHRAV